VDSLSSKLQRFYLSACVCLSFPIMLDSGLFHGAGVAQSVLCLATDWTTKRSRFDPRQRQEDFSSKLCVQTGSGAHPASYPMGTGGFSPRG
jgi:hypothetical protein